MSNAYIEKIARELKAKDGAAMAAGSLVGIGGTAVAAEKLDRTLSNKVSRAGGLKALKLDRLRKASVLGTLAVGGVTTGVALNKYIKKVTSEK